MSELPEWLEKKKQITKHFWRAFNSKTEDGVCDETPDEVYDTGFEDCYKIMAEREKKPRKALEEILKQAPVQSGYWLIAHKALFGEEK